jgi:hypothetical protein
MIRSWLTEFGSPIHAQEQAIPAKTKGSRNGCTDRIRSLISIAASLQS